MPFSRNVGCADCRSSISRQLAASLMLEIKRSLHLIFHRIRQRLLVLQRRPEIKDVEVAAARFAFEKPCSLIERRSTGLCTDDGAAWDRFDLDHSSSASSINPWLSTTVLYDRHVVDTEAAPSASINLIACCGVLRAFVGRLHQPSVCPINGHRQHRTEWRSRGGCHCFVNNLPDRSINSRAWQFSSVRPSARTR